MRKLTHEEQITAIAKVNPKIEVLGKIVKDSTPVLCRCKICHHKWSIKPNDLKQGKGCPKCSRLKQAQRQTLSHKEQVEAIHKKNSNIEVLGEITDNRTKVLCRCKICGHAWKVTPNNLKRGEGCPMCAKLKQVQRQTLSHGEQIEALRERNPSVEILGEITGDKAKVPCRCKICEHVWKSTPNRLKRGDGCPRCAKRSFLSHELGKLYIMVDDLEVPTVMKIGVSVQESKRRDQILKSAQKAGAGITDLHIAKVWEGTTEDMLALESALHQTFNSYKVSFPGKFDGCNEFFYYRPEVFDVVEKLLTQIATLCYNAPIGQRGCGGRVVQDVYKREVGHLVN